MSEPFSVLYEDDRIVLCLLTEQENVPVRHMRFPVLDGYYMKLQTKNEWYYLSTTGASFRTMRYKAQREKLDKLLEDNWNE